MSPPRRSGRISAKSEPSSSTVILDAVDERDTEF